MPRTDQLARFSPLAAACCIVLAACESKPAPATPGPSPAPNKAPASQPAPANASVPSVPSVPAAPPSATNFPSGQETPEGVACELARAFINSDGELLRTISFAITPGSPERDAYNNFLDDTITQMGLARSKPAPADRAAITAVYRSRPLSNPSAAEFGAENFRLTAVRFVDVATAAPGAKPERRRTLVVLDEGSKLWFVVPRPDLFPQLSVGLNDESQSTELWTQDSP